MEAIDKTKNLTQRLWKVEENDPWNGTCPVCGSNNVYVSYDEEEDPGVIVRTYSCGDCGSDYNLTYWISWVHVMNDGRFNKES